MNTQVNTCSNAFYPFSINVEFDTPKVAPLLKYMLTHRAASFFGVRGVNTFIISCINQSSASWMNRFRPLNQFGRLTICRLHGPLNLLIKLNLYKKNGESLVVLNMYLVKILKEK